MVQMAKEIEEFLLTTNDNPYNPFTRFDEWYAFDTQKGYDTCGYMARVILLTDEMSDQEKNKAIEEGIDEILKQNAYAKTIYRKVTKDSEFKIN